MERMRDLVDLNLYLNLIYTDIFFAWLSQSYLSQIILQSEHKYDSRYLRDSLAA